MGYICVRPTILCGHQYYAGDQIAAEHIVPERLKALKESGRIAEGSFDPEEKTGAVEITVPVTGADGQIIDISVPAEAIVQMLGIMQQNADNAAALIEDVTDEKILILIHSIDSRQTVKKAAKAQAEKLAAAEEPAAEE